MKLIVGLGNPGDKYQSTRHNAGFWLVERFAAETRTVMRKDAKFQALVGRHEPSGAWLLLPQGYMNSSGKPVQMLGSFFKIQPAEILVAHDELDFAPGVARIKQGGGVAGHNGLKDVSARLGSHDYWRLRIGIGHPGDSHAVTDFVLHKPSQEDRAAIDAAIGRALEVLSLVLAGDLQGAMLKLHTEEKVENAERPVKPEKAGKPERPVMAAKAPVEEKPRKSRKSVKSEKAETKEKEGLIGSFLKKFLPAAGPTRKK
jgi:peptidyl-tRNA hydrolase, PTH1 family